MPQTLLFTVINAALVRVEQPMTMTDGTAATVSFTKAVIEASPEAEGGKTLSLVLDGSALTEFPEGSEIIVTLTAGKPAPVVDPVPDPIPEPVADPAAAPDPAL